MNRIVFSLFVIAIMFVAINVEARFYFRIPTQGNPGEPCIYCNGLGRCPECNGFGECKTCNGRGVITREDWNLETQAYEEIEETCEECDGWGRCLECSGTGICPDCNGAGMYMP